VEELIGKRPFEEKKILDNPIEPDPIGGVPPTNIPAVSSDGIAGNQEAEQKEV